MNRQVKALSMMALIALLSGCSSPSKEPVPSQTPQTSLSSSTVSSSPASTATSTTPVPTDAVTTIPEASQTPWQATETPTVSQTEPSTNPSWCDSQSGSDATYAGSCPEVQQQRTVVNNKQEAAEYILQEKFYNDADITAAVTHIIPDSQGGGCQYVVVVRSLSMLNGGGSGTLGAFLVTPQGDWEETDIATISQNG